MPTGKPLSKEKYEYIKNHPYHRRIDFKFSEYLSEFGICERTYYKIIQKPCLKQRLNNWPEALSSGSPSLQLDQHSIQLPLNWSLKL